MTGISPEQGLAWAFCSVLNPVRDSGSCLLALLCFLSETRHYKRLSREACPDPEPRNKKPVRQPVFCRQVADASLKVPYNLYLQKCFIFCRQLNVSLQ